MFVGLYAAIAINGIVKAPTSSADIGKTEHSPDLIEAMSLQLNPTKAEIKLALASVSDKYGLQLDELLNVIDCESSFRTDVYSPGMISYGVAQFTRATFEENCAGDYKNPFAQISCMGLMWSKGMQGRWDCYRNLYH